MLTRLIMTVQIKWLICDCSSKSPTLHMICATAIARPCIAGRSFEQVALALQLVNKNGWSPGLPNRVPVPILRTICIYDVIISIYGSRLHARFGEARKWRFWKVTSFKDEAMHLYSLQRCCDISKCWFSGQRAWYFMEKVLDGANGKNSLKGKCWMALGARLP
jgi:hypothetical protein